MQIFHTTREKARSHVAKRKANGFPAKLIDNGAKAVGKRYAVELVSKNATSHK